MEPDRVPTTRREWFDVEAAATFGASNFVVSTVFFVDTPVSFDPVAAPSPVLAVTCATAIGTVVGGTVWALVVTRVPQAPSRSRGAVAGLAISWLSISLLPPTEILVREGVVLSSIDDAVVTFVFWTFVSATVVTVAFGIVVLPVGIVAGWALAYRQSES